MNTLNIPYKGTTISVIIDKDKYEELSQYKWHVLRQERDGGDNYYFRTRVDGGYRYLHRLIMDAPNHKQVDHINGNKLDNRRENLRIVTLRENLRNKKKSTTGKMRYKGYSRNGRTYRVQVSDGKTTWYSYGHETQLQAAKTYDRMAKAIFGEHARTNF